ncbi:hypothetical protein AJ88_35280 [Mesorhizobium amorphae CCBAU 01583]|nr:hypothetical protein AJ88_35280 [Mesorhizobium amorphae CCBAU 01583]
MSAEAVAQAVKAYPAHREEILRFAIEWHAGGESDDSDVPPLPAPDLSVLAWSQSSIHLPARPVPNSMQRPPRVTFRFRS